MKYLNCTFFMQIFCCVIKLKSILTQIWVGEFNWYVLKVKSSCCVWMEAEGVNNRIHHAKSDSDLYLISEIFKNNA